MTCACGCEASSSELIPGKGKQLTCLECGASWFSDGPQAKAVKGVGEEPAFVLTPPEDKPRRQHRARPQAEQPEKPINVVALARRRLREVKREIKRLRKLEAERDQLQRVINAADGKPVAVVTELRRSG